MIIITFPNGDKFELDPKFVAENRADYYSVYEGFSRDSDEWTDEFNHSLKYEIEDWLANNLDWNDIKDNVVKIERIDIDYNEYFKKGDIEITRK